MKSQFRLPRIRFIQVFLFLLSGVKLCHAQDAAPQPIENPSEIWVGTLDVGVAKLRLQINLLIDENGKVTKAEMLSLDQTSTPLPIDRVLRTGEKLAFAISPLGVSYEGSVDASGQIASGNFVQQGRKFELELRLSKEGLQLTHESTWNCQFSVGPQKYDFQFRVFSDNFQTRSAKLDSFTEGLWSIPCEFEDAEGKIAFRNRLTGGEFEGVLSSDGQSIEGAWNQRGLSIPVTAKKVPLAQTRETKFHRPQTPTPPFPYAQKAAGVVVKEIDPQYEDKVGIALTMTMPNEGGPFPAVILINGTGQQDRDFTFFEHKPFAIMADHLTRQGYAVIRYDDRGVGQSVGPTAQATLLNYANDAEAVYRWAKQQPEIDSKRIVLLGHSEGAILAGLIAMRQPDVAGVILLAGMGVSGKQFFVDQTASLAKVSGVPEDVINRQQQFLTEVLTEAKKGTIEPARVQELFAEHFRELTDQQKMDYGLMGVPENTYALMRSPWMGFFLDYDPRTALAYLKCPILSLFGEKDVQSNPQVQAPKIQSATEIAQNLDFEQEILPGLNHMFQPSQTGSPREYYAIETTISQTVLEKITAWLDRRFKR
jgi:uncharacterized protein